jgi:hypothetical protein
MRKENHLSVVNIIMIHQEMKIQKIAKKVDSNIMYLSIFMAIFLDNYHISSGNNPTPHPQEMQSHGVF